MIGRKHNKQFISTLTSGDIKTMKGGLLNGLVSINTQNDFQGASQYDTDGLHINTEHQDDDSKAAGQIHSESNLNITGVSDLKKSTKVKKVPKILERLKSISQKPRSPGGNSSQNNSFLSKSNYPAKVGGFLSQRQVTPKSSKNKQ